MRKPIIVLVSALALALPSVDALAASKSAASITLKKKVTIASKSFTGSTQQADQWGFVQVTIVVRKTTTRVGTKKTVKRKLLSVKVPTFPNHTDRSVFISQQSLPMLVQEALQSQSSNINLVSGATYTSQAFQSSLTAAILKAKSW